MSTRHNRQHKSATRHRDETSRTKSKKSSHKSNSKRRDNDSRTPPLPKHSIGELLKQRRSLQDELHRLERSKNSRNNVIVIERKHKLDHKHSIDDRNVKKPKLKASPDVITEHLDSEEEENIIEQRRLQRKQLLEKFNETEILPENKMKDTTVPKTNNESHGIIDTKRRSREREIDNMITDMFSEKDDFVHKNSKAIDDKADVNNTQLFDNWDDEEGYYNIRPGDVLNKKFVLKDILGQGVFATVVKALDNTQNNNPVAIKIVRNNELIHNTSLKEISILKEISDADPDDKGHCIRLLGHFTHKGHLCILLEPLHMDLRSVLKKYGRNKGISMKALVSYSRQLFMALRLLKKIGIIHADIKPDNILVNEKKNLLKLCDFGSAAKVTENEPTPYLVSRFYRAPEIILGIAYNHAIDVWSTACTIYEMATGKILFTGGSNNKMLKCFMDLKGRIPVKLIKKGKFKDQHFNYNNNFLLHKKDEFTGREKVVEICSHSVNRELHKELLKSNNYWTPTEEKKILQLKDLLDKMLILDFNQRISVTDCLKHSFVQN